jgi:hypothetical protein
VTRRGTRAPSFGRKARTAIRVHHAATVDLCSEVNASAVSAETARYRSTITAAAAAPSGGQARCWRRAARH